MKNIPIDKNDSALLVVDIQEKLFDVMDEKVRNQLIKNSLILIEACSVFNIPVILTEQYRKGLGPTVKPIQEKNSNIPLYEKTTFDCMNDKNISIAVKSLKRKTIILCGIESHICVFQTALSLLKFGYKVIVAGDAVMSRRKSNWSLALKALTEAGALVYSTESIAFMLIEDSKTSEFKKLAPFFK